MPVTSSDEIVLGFVSAAALDSGSTTQTEYGSMERPFLVSYESEVSGNLFSPCFTSDNQRFLFPLNYNKNSCRMQ